MMNERVESVYMFCSSFSFYVILVLCHTFISNQGKTEWLFQDIRESSC